MNVLHAITTPSITSLTSRLFKVSTMAGMQVADFLGCKKIKDGVIEWLQQVVIDVANESNQHAGTPSATSDSLLDAWHFTQV